METTFNKKFDQIQGAISKLENDYTECMDMIIENSNRMDKLTEQTTTNHRMIEQLFTFTIRQLYSNHKGLQSEKDFISLAQSFFNVQIGVIQNIIGEDNRKKFNQQTAHNHV